MGKYISNCSNAVQMDYLCSKISECRLRAAEESKSTPTMSYYGESRNFDKYTVVPQPLTPKIHGYREVTDCTVRISKACERTLSYHTSLIACNYLTQRAQSHQVTLPCWHFTAQLWSTHMFYAMHTRATCLPVSSMRGCK